MTESQDIVACLRELVELKDGPRDADYERCKPLAWQRARAALAALEHGELNVHVEYAARFNDGHIGPEQNDLSGAKAYVRYVIRQAGADLRGGIAAIVRRTVATYVTDWEDVQR